jgi:hypothetical protein
MRIFKNIEFNRWATKMEIEDETLKTAINEITAGLHNGSLGGHLFKKRIGLKGRGKSGGVRTIVVFKKDEKAFFVYGFAKNKRANISEIEERSLKKLGALYLAFNDDALNYAIKNRQLMEVL